jgi:hypothetical protein
LLGVVLSVSLGFAFTFAVKNFKRPPPETLVNQRGEVEMLQRGLLFDTREAISDWLFASVPSNPRDNLRNKVKIAVLVPKFRGILEANPDLTWSDIVKHSVNPFTDLSMTLTSPCLNERCSEIQMQDQSTISTAYPTFIGDAHALATLMNMKVQLSSRALCVSSSVKQLIVEAAILLWYRFPNATASDLFATATEIGSQMETSIPQSGSWNLIQQIATLTNAATSADSDPYLVFLDIDHGYIGIPDGADGTHKSSILIENSGSFVSICNNANKIPCADLTEAILRTSPFSISSLLQFGYTSSTRQRPIYLEIMIRGEREAFGECVRKWVVPLRVSYGSLFSFINGIVCTPFPCELKCQILR